MCGITGIIERKKSVSVDILKSMQKTLKHRGPDDNGYATFNLKNNDAPQNIGVAHVRLSIRDLSANGHQPMYNNEGNIMIAFNGEIYNSEELRPLLVDKYKFKSHSDTEVLLYMYQEFGLDETLKRIDGMYAICMVDFRQEVMYLIRDKVGEKPLYYYDNGETFMFASEYKAFYCHPDFKAEIDEDNVDEYFLFRYVADGKSLLKGVTNLKPGSYIRYGGGKIEHVQYWELPESSAQNKLSDIEYKQKFEELLRKSVSRRSISDVPVGIQLSGGVDSSVLSYYLKENLKGNLNSYSIVMDEFKFSEEKYVDHVNKTLSLAPHKIPYNAENFFNTWLETTWYFEQPMNHEGTIGLLKLNKIAKENVSVMMCGEGADESLAGYNRFFYNFNNKTFSYRLLQPYRYCKGKLFGANKWKFLTSMYTSTKDTNRQFITLIQSLSNDTFNHLRPKPIKNIETLIDERYAMMNRTKSEGLQKLVNYELYTYLQDLLMRADKVSMASSLELRVPYIMPELLEFEATMPDSLRINIKKKRAGLSTKIILKELCSKLFGRDFTYRDKVGFYVPVHDYFKSGETKIFIEEKILPGIKRRGLLNYDYIYGIWNKLVTKGFDYSDMQSRHLLWSTFSFELWAQMYIDNNPLTWEHKEF